jgi:hypothetical protein
VLDMARPACVLLSEFRAGPSLRQIRAVPPFARRVGKLRKIKQHRREPVPAVISAGGCLLRDLQLFERGFNADDELLAHLRSRQAVASRQRARIEVPAECETGINE